MRAIAVLLACFVTGCCCGKRSAPAPAVDIADPVVLRNTQGGTKVQLLDSEGLCGNTMIAVATQNWPKVVELSKPPAGCEVSSGTKATLLRRTSTCWKVRVDGGACRGTWWTTSDWAATE